MCVRIALVAAVALAGCIAPDALAATAHDQAFARFIAVAERHAAAAAMALDQRDRALGHILAAYARHREFAAVEAVAAGISDRDARATMLIGAAERSMTADDGGAAIAALLRMADAAAAGNDHLLGRIAHLQARNGEIGQALATSKRMRAAAERDQALYDIGTVQAERGDIAGALATTEAIAPDPWRYALLSSIATVQARAGDMREARATAARCGDTRDVTLRSMAEARAKAGDRESAVALAREIGHPVLQATALWKIAEADMAAQDVGAARASYRQARAIAERMPAGSGRGGLLATIASSEARVNLGDDALETVDALARQPQMQRGLYGGDGLVWALANIARAQARSGRGEVARQTAERARQALRVAFDPHDAAITFVTMALAIGDVELALVVARSICLASGSSVW